jgi:hypothetical protein
MQLTQSNYDYKVLLATWFIESLKQQLQEWSVSFSTVILVTKEKEKGKNIQLRIRFSARESTTHAGFTTGSPLLNALD